METLCGPSLDSCPDCIRDHGMFNIGLRSMVSTNRVHSLDAVAHSAMRFFRTSVAFWASVADCAASRTPSRYSVHGAVMISNFLPTAIFEALRSECRALKGAMKKEAGSMAVGRMARVLDRRVTIFDTMSHAAVARVNKACADGLFYMSEFPAEVRLYKVGSSMDWHRDDLLYDQPQCEVVLTLENTSDSETQWMDETSGEIQAHWTPPNSALLVRAGPTGAQHRVSELHRGERLILKVVCAQEGSRRAADFMDATTSLHGMRPKVKRALERSGRRSRTRTRSGAHRRKNRP